MMEDEKLTSDLVASGRAMYAYLSVKSLFEKNPGKKEEYTSYIKKLPAMIKTNGLAQSLAFYCSKKGSHKEIYQVIDKWFRSEAKHLPFKVDQDFVQFIISCESDLYRFATMETLDLLNWMRRFANGLN